MAIRSVNVARWRDAAWAQVHDEVVEEAPLEIYAQGTRVMTLMRTPCGPTEDIELVTGLLHAEGLRGGAVVVEAGGPHRVDVGLPSSAFAPRAAVSTAACGVCGRAGVDDLASGQVQASAATVALATLWAAMARLEQAQARFRATGGIHAAGLFGLAGELRVAREDVGRHNAVDKVIGWALTAGLAPEAHMVLVSGRLGFELVQKTVRFGAPIIAAVSAPSSAALELAERHGVTAVGFVRPGRANVYTHAQRIV